MGPWDSKLRWQPGGNFQPTRLTCEFNWRECPYAIGKYFWSEVYTDVADFLSSNNEDLLQKGAFLFAISIIVYSIIYWKIRRMREKKINNSIINKIAFDIQDLELRVDILSYKLQHGTWPSLQQITNIYEIEDINKDKIRLSVSATDNSKCNQNLWLKKLFTNNYLKIKSSCNLFGECPCKDCDSRSFEDLKTLPKTFGNINFDDGDKSVKEMQIMSNNFSHKTDDNKNGPEKVDVLDDVKEDTKALNENNKNKEEIERRNKKLLGVHESQKNSKNVCEIKESGKFIHNNNDNIRIVVVKEEEQKDEKKDIKKPENEEQNYSKKDKNMSNNLNSSAKLNGTLEIVKENSAVFSASESVVPELEKQSLKNSKVFFQPEIIFNPPSLNNLPTIESTFKSTKPKREKAIMKSLEDVKKRLENLYCVLQMYENEQEFNLTELNEHKKARKLLAQTFIQELSDFSMISESETDNKSNINYEKKYYQMTNPIHQLNGLFFKTRPSKTEENYGGSSIEDDSDSCKSNQTEKQEITETCTEDDIIAFDKASRDIECNSLMLERHLMKVHTGNSIKSNENLMRIDEPLIELQEDKYSEEESKFNESYKFFINSKSLYQSNLSDIISESDHIEETDGTDNRDRPNIVVNTNNINFYHQDQIVNDLDVKTMENSQKLVENKKIDIEQLIDIFDSDSLMNKEVSRCFKTVPDHYTDEVQIDQNQIDSIKNLEDIFMNLEKFDACRNNLIDLNDDEAKKNKNHDLSIKDHHHKNKQYLDIEESHLQITDDIKVFENIKSLDTKIVKVKNMKENPITENCIGITGKNYFISGKTFIKENIKKTLENNFEDKSLIELNSINISSKHQISHDQYEINKIDDIRKTFKDINSDNNFDSIYALPRKSSVELKEKMIFDEKSDAENSEIMLNKLLIKNNCENLSEIEFDVGLEMQEHSKSECEKNSLLNTLSESSSLYLTGKGSFSDISNNEKITDLIELNTHNKENKIIYGYNRNEEQKSQKNKKKEDDEERITITSKDSAFYETPQSSVMTINNIRVGNNDKNLDINIYHNNFDCDQYSFEKELSQNKLKSPKKRSKLEKGRCERATVKTEKSSNISTSREPTKLLDERLNRFPTNLNVKSNNFLKKDIKGSKQKLTGEHKRNDNLHKSKIAPQNDAKTTLKDLKINKLSLKAKSNLNLLHDFGQDLKNKKGLEGRSKSYITPRKFEPTSKSMFNNLINKKHQRNHSLADRTTEKNSENSKLGLCKRKSTMSSKLDLDLKSRSRESINKSWKSNIPILKSRIEHSKDKNTTNTSHKNFSIKESLQLGDTENMLSCIKSNFNVQSYENNFSSKNCIGLCKKFNQASAECKEVCLQEKNTLIKDSDIERNSWVSTLGQENQIVFCQQKEMQVLVKPPVVETRVSEL
ncbi:putative histone-lysine N-methyltransferase 1 isoform X2 [Chelonus insularis]|uniref:putative histone-lysine N-methyltransferase 1 isoform X2 n=1 Tax=Chelonus insularis TaxID=460826 RepID=UPI00158E369F|nr:putative histone-lysine N-methyltransferase 1 isoform X2 [Chelonus insularis]